MEVEKRLAMEDRNLPLDWQWSYRQEEVQLRAGRRTHKRPIRYQPRARIWKGCFDERPLSPNADPMELDR